MVLPRLPFGAWWASICQRHEAETTDELELALRQLTWSIEDIQAEIASALLPALRQMSENIEAFLRAWGITIA